MTEATSAHVPQVRRLPLSGDSFSDALNAPVQTSEATKTFPLLFQTGSLRLLERRSPKNQIFHLSNRQTFPICASLVKPVGVHDFLARFDVKLGVKLSLGPTCLSLSKASNNVGCRSSSS